MLTKLSTEPIFPMIKLVAIHICLENMLDIIAPTWSANKRFVTKMNYLRKMKLGRGKIKATKAISFESELKLLLRGWVEMHTGAIEETCGQHFKSLCSHVRLQMCVRRKSTQLELII